MRPSSFGILPTIVAPQTIFIHKRCRLFFQHPFQLAEVLDSDLGSFSMIVPFSPKHPI